LRRRGRTTSMRGKPRVATNVPDLAELEHLASDSRNVIEPVYRIYVDWYCGLCQFICPTHAITIVFPEQMVRSQTDVTTLLGKLVD